MRPVFADLGKWLTESRNVPGTARRSRGSRATWGISIAIDSNDTNSTAECYVGEIFFRKP